MRRYFLLATAALLGISACDGSIMDVGPRDQLSEVVVFTDPNLAIAVINDIYRGLGHGLNGTTLWAMEDDGHNTRNGGTMQHMQSNVTPSSLQDMGGVRFQHYRWQDLYASIRQVNVFMESIAASEIDPALKERLRGEAYFLRAYFYQNLLRIFGGVPIITRVYALDDDFQVTRNSFAETVDFIVASADSAASRLPLRHPPSDLGRATRGAALALKSRVLLYAASDLYQINPSGMPETGYTGARDRTAAWRAARDAARDVMDLGIYGLFRAEPGTGESPGQNYADIWLSGDHPEIILGRYFLASRGATDIPNVGRYDGPNGYHNWGSNTPTQNLVDAYRMVDGSRFDWNNPIHAAAPYENRDPRFYASIHHDGASWVPRPPSAVQYDSVGIIQTFRQLTLPDGTIVPGLDTRQGPIEDWNGTYSGYYKRKSIDPAVDHQYVSQQVPWLFFRYAEILLNYAEAALELGEEGEAIRVINQVRHRAGMPPVEASLAGSTLRDEYRNERRIELVFEEHRYFDARRWMIAPRVFGENARGIEIMVRATNSHDRSTYHDYSYRVIDVQQRRWEDKMYFMPIHRDEMNRNPLLVQNPGY